MWWCTFCQAHTERRDGPLYRRICDECGEDYERD